MLKNKLVLIIGVVVVVLAAVGYYAWSQNNSGAVKPVNNNPVAPAEVKAPVANKGKILMVIAFKDFLDKDYFEPKKIFQDNGYTVDTLSTEKGKAKSVAGKEADVNVLAGEIKSTDYQAIVFSGGPGMCEQDKNQDYLNLAKTFNSENKVIGGICFGGKILSSSGILKDRQASIPDKFAESLKKEGGTYVKNDLVVDGNIVTAPEPTFNQGFAQAIIDLLNKK